MTSIENIKTLIYMTALSLLLPVADLCAQEVKHPTISSPTVTTNTITRQRCTPVGPCETSVETTTVQVVPPITQDGQNVEIDSGKTNRANQEGYQEHRRSRVSHMREGSEVDDPYFITNFSNGTSVEILSNARIGAAKPVREKTFEGSLGLYRENINQEAAYIFTDQFGEMHLVKIPPSNPRRNDGGNGWRKYTHDCGK
jgi:hypothetical protein